MLAAYSWFSFWRDMALRYSAMPALERFECIAVVSERWGDQGAKTIDLLARVDQKLDSALARGPEVEATGAALSRTVFEIERAIATARWSEAESLIKQLEAASPGDPALAVVREQFSAARDRVKQQQLARLEAARDVNDPQSVLEFYENLTPVLDQEPRGALKRDLAKWFLTLIQRRLRTGKIQPEVVQLAERVADVFATTVEGASVRASLPMLRRSVGQCPRCAHPIQAWPTPALVVWPEPPQRRPAAAPTASGVRQQ